MPRPETVICYICGCECSANSVKFHEKQCAKKWEAERQRELEKAKREEKRERVRPKQRERVRSESSDDGERLKRSGSYSKLLSVKLGDEKVRRKSLSVGDLTGGSSGEDLTDKELMHAERPNTVVLRKKSSTSRERPGTVTLSSYKERPRTASVSSASSTSSSSSHNTTPNSSPKRKLPTTPASKGASDVLLIVKNSTTSTQRKPNFQANLVKCYICGKELTLHSIKIHEVQCMKKWDAQKQKDKREAKEDKKYKRRSAPAVSSHTTIERPSTYNVTDKRHQTGDAKYGSDTSEKENGNGSIFTDSSSEGSSECFEGNKEIKPSSSGKPNWQPCYICGREFSLKSLPIHEPQCSKKWEAYKSQKEKLEKRKSSPAKYVSSSSNRSGLSPVQSKIGCENCNRLFTPRQLVEHSKLCIASSGTNVKLRNQQKTDDSTKRNSRVTCYVCGKEFGRGTIISHEPQCLKKHKQQQNTKEGVLKGPMTQKDKIPDVNYELNASKPDDNNIVKTNPEQIVGKENVVNGSTETQV